VVLNHHLLYLRMTLITFQDGKPVLRDGKVGTEQECCCGECLVFFGSPPFYGYAPEDWGPPSCFHAILSKVVERLQDAGWTAELDESTIVVDGEERIAGIVKASCECCFKCEDWVPIVSEANITNNFELTDQPAGRWCNIADFDPHTLPDNPCFNEFGYPVFTTPQPVFYFRGCGFPEPYGPVWDQDLILRQFQGYPRLVGDINGGGLYGQRSDIWVPCCNPDNCDGNPLP
jgi:hypothetical protein